MEELLLYSVSCSDIRRITKNNNIVPYSRLKAYKTIDELLGDKLACFILFQEEEFYGHWTILSRCGNLLEHFDSYGFKPEEEKKYINNKEFIEPINYLNILMKNSPYEVSYNEFPFQMKDNYIGTCGKWCMLRYMFKDMNLYKFKDMIMKDMKKLNIKYPDIFVCRIFFYNYNI
jgi:hypothetical protein